MYFIINDDIVQGDNAFHYTEGDPFCSIRAIMKYIGPFQRPEQAKAYAAKIRLKKFSIETLYEPTGSQSSRLHLRGLNGATAGLVWEATDLLRAGRLAMLEMAVDDVSVSRQHAEVHRTSHGWCVRDLGSSNGTFLNGTRLGPGEWPLHPHDILQFGNVTVTVEFEPGENDPP